MNKKELRVIVTDRGKDGKKVTIDNQGLYAFEVMGLCEFVKDVYRDKVNKLPDNGPKEAGE